MKYALIRRERENNKVFLMTTRQLILYLLQLLKSPYLIGFYKGHIHLSDAQVNSMLDLLSSEDIDLQAQVVKQYENRFANLVGNGYSCSFASGRMAFFSLMRSIGIGPGDEVIIPGFTCSVVPNAILRTGAKPIYSDIDTATLGSDASAIERCITPQTKMIVAQHSFGIPCNIDEIADLANSKGIFLVEDSAMALDSRIRGKSVGNWGDAAFFSTDHSKPLNTIIGGLLYTTHKDIFEDVKKTVINLPDLSQNHQRNIFRRFNYERKNFIPSRYPRSIIRETVTFLMGDFFRKPLVFLEGDYTVPISSPSPYPYPAKMPAFLAQLGLFEIEKWSNEKIKRKKLLHEYVKCSEFAGSHIQIPKAYSQKEKEIVPLRFIFRSPQSEILKKRFGSHIDARGMLFSDPVFCPNGPHMLGYRRGNCVNSETVCSDILNMPCVLPEGWDELAVTILHDVISGSNYRMEEFRSNPQLFQKL